jgi:S1-C subfamily serine protease
MIISSTVSYAIWISVFIICFLIAVALIKKNKKLIRIILFLIVVGGIGSVVYYIGQSQTLDASPPSETVNTPIDNQYYDQTAKSVVHIVHVFKNETSTINANASAVIFYADDEFYYAVTNYHVLVMDDYETDSLKVRDYLNNEHDAVSMVDTQLLAIASESYDLGLIRFPKTVDIPPVEYSNLTLSEGMQVHSVGYPGGIRSLTTGEYRGRAIMRKFPFFVIEHSSEIDHGSSGGALLDKNGRLLGINAAAMLASNDEFLTGYAIPVDKVLEYIDLFKEI